LGFTKHHALARAQRDPCTVNRDTGWKSVGSFMPQPLYLQGINSCYALNIKLDGSDSQDGSFVILITKGP